MAAMEADLIVIGGGMAGALAALRAAAQGREVLLVRKGHGASAMSSGAIDLVGPGEFLPLDEWDTLPTTTDRLKDILRAEPLHPYSIIAGGRNGIERLHVRLREAFDFLFEKIPGFHGSHERNLALATVMGTVKFCAFAPASMVGGDLVEMRDARLLLVGLKGLPHFRPGLCMRGLKRYSSLHPPQAISQIDVIELDVPISAETQTMTMFDAARLFDDPPAIEEFAHTLRKQIAPGVTHVGLPPVLGLDNHAEAFQRLDGELDAKVFELVSPNFSVPGHRLHLSLEAALRDGGVRVVTAEVSEVECDGRLVKNLVLKGMKTRRTATARSYVLATGKFSAGGLVGDDFPREPLFGLPLFAGARRVDDGFIQDLLEWDAEKRQPFLSCGLHVNASLKPLDPFGEPAYENLFAAGSIIGEYDYVNDKCGFGVAALTGSLAGEMAAQ